MKRAVLLWMALPSVALGYAFKVDDAVPARRPTWPVGTVVNFTLASDRPANIRAGTDVLGDLRRGLAVWEESSGMRFGIVDGGSGLSVAQDGQNVITFANTAANRDVLGEFQALAFIWWDANAVLIEADMVFRTDVVTWGDVPDGVMTLDLQGLCAHEAGHAIAMEHTGIQSATMFPYGGPDQLWRRTLDGDDRAGARDNYDRRRFTGSIGGTVTVGGQPAFKAHVVVEQGGRPVASAVTLHDGVYAIHNLAPGAYRVYVEPADGPLQPTDFVGGEWNALDATTAFATTYAAGDVTVASAAVTVNLAPAAGAGPNLRFVTPSPDGTGFPARGPYAVQLAPSSTGHLALMGAGVDQVADTAFTAGDGVTLGTVTGRGVNGDNVPYAIIQYTVAANAQPGPRTLHATTQGGARANLTGALLVGDCHEAGGTDPDADAVCVADNCPNVANADQDNRDGDSAGDLCDACPDDPLITTGSCGGASSSSSAAVVSSSSVGRSSSAVVPQSSSAVAVSSSVGASSAPAASGSSGGGGGTSSSQGASADPPEEEGCSAATVHAPGVAWWQALVALGAILVWRRRAR